MKRNDTEPPRQPIQSTQPITPIAPEPIDTVEANTLTPPAIPMVADIVEALTDRVAELLRDRASREGHKVYTDIPTQAQRNEDYHLLSTATNMMQLLGKPRSQSADLTLRRMQTPYDPLHRVASGSKDPSSDSQERSSLADYIGRGVFFRSSNGHSIWCRCADCTS